MQSLALKLVMAEFRPHSLPYRVFDPVGLQVRAHTHPDYALLRVRACIRMRVFICKTKVREEEGWVCRRFLFSCRVT